MERSKIKIKKVRERRVFRVRKSLKGDASRPRMSVYKSNRNLYVQLIDDESRSTLLGKGTFSKEMQKLEKETRVALAKRLGKQLGEEAKKKGIEKVVFDRGRHKYHGVIAALADGAREVGLQF